MGLSRRQFLKWAGVTGIGAVVFNGCRIPDHEIRVQSSIQLPEDLVTGRDNYYATVAQGTAGSEGLLVRVMEGRAKKVEGNPDYPVNTGAHSLRSEALLQALYHPDRIAQPLVRVVPGGPYRPIEWPEALERLATILREVEDPASVLMAVGPARGAVADVINRFAQGYGARVMGFEPLDHTVLRGAMNRLFGQQALPTFDLARTNFLLGFGADFLGTWLSPVQFSRGYGEFRQGEGRERGRFVQVDTRYSLTAAAADRWIYVSPGTEGLLAMAMAHTIINEGLANGPVPFALTSGSGAAAIASFAPDAVAGQIGIEAQDIIAVARAFADPANRPALAIGGGSAAAHTNGLFNMVAIYALNLLVGSVNQPGGLIFNPASPAQVRSAPLREWRATLDGMRAGNVSVLLVCDANLVHGLPGLLGPQGALRRVGTIVSFSSFLDETTAMADLILPGHTPLEEWGTDAPEPGPGFETLAFQQPVVRNYRNTLSFGDILLQTGRELGLEAQLPWPNMREAVRATALALHEAGRGSVTMPTFEEFWRRTLERGGWWDMDARVTTPVPTPPPLPTAPLEAQIAGDPNVYPFMLVPFEHIGVGGGQYAHLPWAQSAADPITTAAWGTWVEMSPQDAARLGVSEHDVVLVESPTGGAFHAPVYVNPATAPGVIAMPFGQGHDLYTRYAAGRGGNVYSLLAPSEDQETGGFAWAATRVQVRRTTRRQVVAKREGLEEPRQFPHEEVILVHRPNGASH